MVERIKDVESEVLRIIGKPDNFVRIVAHELFEIDGVFRFRVDVWIKYINPLQESDWVGQVIGYSYFLHVFEDKDNIEIVRSWPVLKKHEPILEADKKKGIIQYVY